MKSVFGIIFVQKLRYRITCILNLKVLKVTCKSEAAYYNFNAGRLSGSESNLVAYYNMNEASGTTLTDLTSNSNNGTATNISLLDITTNNNMGTLTNMTPSSDWSSSNGVRSINQRRLCLIFSNTKFYINGSTSLSSPVSGQILGSLLTNLWTQGMTGSDAPEASNANVWTLNVSGQSWTALTEFQTQELPFSWSRVFSICV